MHRKKLLFSLTCLIVAIFAVNYAAMKFFWYFSIWYFDMPMHLFGGLWLGLAYIWLFPREVYSGKMVLRLILSVLLVGLLWEVFEFFVNETVIKNPLNYQDIFSDILFDLAGGFLAVYLCRNKTMSIDESNI